ncbi:MAG: FAD-dependent oxidoreductase [Rubrivivax sp.]|nr:FAD-dependent oxidoreductase [Rubrivivax sp.]
MTTTPWVPGGSPAALFANYTQRPRQGPQALWWALRLLVLALAVGEIALLFVRPQLGLALFWTVAVPCLPALWAIAPGLWRQVCPMALVNQLPRTLGIGAARALPKGAEAASYLLAVALLVAMVALRRPLLNQEGWATGAMCAAALGLALAGGLVFKGRSGWCGTFCPLSPVQRSHGQAPIVVVRNGYCPTCVGCQKNCLDFNPRAAIHGDLADAGSRGAMQKLWFMAMLPGLIVGYYTLGGVLQQGGPGRYFAALAAGLLASAGLFLLLRAVFATTAYRMASVFGVLALLLYYVWAGPVLVAGVAGLAGAVPDEWLVDASRIIGVPIVMGVWRASLAGERAYQALERGDTVRIDDSRLASAGRGAAQEGRPVSIEILERRSGRRFAAAPGKTLLDSMQAAGVPIDFGCRSGLCGADAVGIVEGHDNLDEPGADEAATLKRLGLTGCARLACSARARGPVTIDCDARSVPPREPLQPAAPREDRALASGVRRVVIIGNGAAGMSAAETLREASPSVAIDVIAGEPHPFYNRMALGRVVYSPQGMNGLYLLPEAWYPEHRVNVHLNAVAVRIARDDRCVHLSNGDTLPYDRLVLATGARATLPSPRYKECKNAFVLRSAAHAQAIRAAVQAQGLRHAVVIGGGVLGVEAAEALHHLGLRVTVLHRRDRLMERQLDAEGAQRLAGYLENHGIEVLTDARIEHFEIDEGPPVRLATIQLDDGRRVAGDLFVACAGVKPNVSLAADAGLELGKKGVRVDERMATADAAVFAVGDAAEPPAGSPFGATGLWPVAVQHGRIAAAALLGEAPPAPSPEATRLVLQLKSEGIDLRSFGDTAAVPEGAEVLTADPADIAWWRLVVHQGRIAAGVYVGPPGTAHEVTRAMQTGADLGTCLAALRQRRLELAEMAQR